MFSIFSFRNQKIKSAVRGAFCEQASTRWSSQKSARDENKHCLSSADSECRADTELGQSRVRADPKQAQTRTQGSITRQTRGHGRHGPWVTSPRPLSCKKIKTTPRNVVLETWFGWETANLNEKGGREINIWKRPTISGNLTYNRNNNSSDIYIRIKRELFCRLNKINDYDSWV